MKLWPAIIDSEPAAVAGTLPVRDKWTGEPFAEAGFGDAADVERALAAAARSQAAGPPPRHERARVLREAAAIFRGRRRELAELCRREAGKPLALADGEVDRLVVTFELAAAVALDATEGEVLDLSQEARTAGYRGMTRRVPAGVCSFITPFNFPLNLVAHKVAPAVAAGCPFVLKPADRTPLGALAIGGVLTEVGAAGVSVVPASVGDADPLVSDDRPAVLSFTGSAAVGWGLKARAGRKRVVFELGGNAACVVDETCLDRLDLIVKRLVTAAFGYAGQTCISVQRLYLHEAIYDEARDRLVAAARGADADALVGPMIDDAAAERVEAWIAGSGGTVLCGGTRAGNRLTPAVVEDVPDGADLWDEEVFGPVVCLRRFEDFDACLADVNRSRFGLQAGVFTRDVGRAMRAWEALEVGGVVVNDTPSFRADAMPYGGVGDSGLGREGVAAAVRDLTEPRLLVVAPG